MWVRELRTRRPKQARWSFVVGLIVLLGGLILWGLDPNRIITEPDDVSEETEVDARSWLARNEEAQLKQAGERVDAGDSKNEPQLNAVPDRVSSNIKEVKPKPKPSQSSDARGPFVSTKVIEFDRSCDPCLENGCITDKKELKLYEDMKELCSFNKTPGVDMSTWQEQKPGARFVIVTMLEPSWRSPEYGILKNVIRLTASLDKHFPYQADHMILFDDSNVMEMRMLQRVTHRKLVFVDVKNEFKETPERMKFFNSPISICQGDYSYRAMCRFGSGPIFWMDVLKDYDFFIRLDEDAYFTQRLPTNLVDNLIDTGSGYGYVLENPSSSQCRIGLDRIVIDFLNGLDHDASGRPWIRFGDFKFNRDAANNERDSIDATKIKKRPVRMDDDLSQGSLGFDPDLRTTITYYTYNCNFEVVNLSYFRHPHYRKWWQLVDKRGLFFSTRMGDHEVKTTYLDLFSENSNIVCYADLPYYHHNHHDEWCRYNNMVYLFNTTKRHRLSNRPQRG